MCPDSSTVHELCSWKRRYVSHEKYHTLCYVSWSAYWILPLFKPTGLYMPIIKVWRNDKSMFNLVIPWSRVLPEKLTGPQILKKFPTFYGIQTFITAFRRARFLILWCIIFAVCYVICATVILAFTLSTVTSWYVYKQEFNVNRLNLMKLLIQHLIYIVFRLSVLYASEVRPSISDTPCINTSLWWINVLFLTF